MKRLIEKYWSWLVVAAAIGSSLIFVLYNLLIWFKVASIGETYSFFSFVHPDPLVNLAPYFQKILNGYWWISDGKTFEHLNAPNLWSWLNPIIVAPLILILKNISMTFLVGTWLAVLAVFFIFYYIAKRLTGNRFFSLGFTIIFSVASLIWEFLFPISLKNFKVIAHTVFHLGSFTTDALMSRYISFSIFPTWPVFALAFLFTLLAIVTRRKKWAWAAGLCSGLLIYMVITDAIYFLAGLCFAIILFVIEKRYDILKTIFWIFPITALVSGGYWFNFLNIRLLPWSQEFYYRLSGEFTHQFRFSFWPEYLAYLIMAWLVWQWGKRYQKTAEATFVISFILAGIGVLNIQVLFGFNPAPTVWFEHQIYFGLALGWLILFHWLYEFCSQHSPKWKLISAGVVIFFIVAIVSRVVATNIYMADYLYPHYFIPKNIQRSLDWLDKKTPRDSVVVSPSLVTNALIPALTHNRVVPAVAITSPASQTELLDRWFVVYKLFQVSPDYFRGALLHVSPRLDNFALGQEQALTTFIVDSYFTSNKLDATFNNRNSDEIPPEKINEIITDFKRYPTRPEYLFGRYKMDYFYVGPYERRITNVNFERIKFLDKVYDKEEIQIYKIKR